MLAINSRRPRLASEGLRSRLTAGLRAGPVFALALDDLRALGKPRRGGPRTTACAEQSSTPRPVPRSASTESALALWASGSFKSEDPP